RHENVAEAIAPCPAEPRPAHERLEAVTPGRSCPVSPVLQAGSDHTSLGKIGALRDARSTPAPPATRPTRGHHRVPQAGEVATPEDRLPSLLQRQQDPIERYAGS